jgi:hypothetical protein
LDLADRFFLLFRANEHTHGVHEPGAPDPITGKAKGNTFLARGPLTPSLWRRHLDGIEGVGPVPIFNGSKVVFGAIDVDTKNGQRVYLEGSEISIEDLESSAEGLPLVKVRSKSGGWHLYLFTKEPVEAKLLTAALNSIAIKLGVGGNEIFPKQGSLSQESNRGSYINAPYFGDSRHCYVKGKPLSPEAFLDHVEEMKVSPEFLMKHSGLAEEQERRQRRAPKTPAALFTDGPPCLARFVRDGIQPGTRNNVCLNIAVYFKARFGDIWPEEFRRWLDDAQLGADFDQTERENLIKSVARSDYHYQCKTEPLKSNCESLICRMRTYGVGSGENLPSIVDMVLLRGELLPSGRTTAVYQTYLDGEEEPLVVTPDDLLTFKGFARALLAQRAMPIPTMKDKDFRAYINDALSRATVDRDRNDEQIALQRGETAVRDAINELVSNAVRHPDASLAAQFCAVVILDGKDGTVLVPHHLLARAVRMRGGSTLTPILLARIVNKLGPTYEARGWLVKVDTTKIRAINFRPTEDAVDEVSLFGGD